MKGNPNIIEKYTYMQAPNKRMQHEADAQTENADSFA